MVAALVVLVLVLALTPAVQTWAARKAVAGQPGLKADIGRVAVGLSSVSVRDTRLQQDGLILILPSADIELPLLSAAGKKIAIQRLTAKGWTVDLTAPVAGKTAAVMPVARRATAGYLGLISSAQAQMPAAATQAVFAGVFQQLQLPVDLSIETMELEGDVIFPVAPGQPAGRAHIVIKGGQLGVGRDARIVIDATVALSGADAPVQSLTMRTVIAARMDTPHSFDKLGLVADATAIGPKFPSGATVKADVSAEKKGAAEAYRVLVDAAGKRLLTLDTTMPAGASRLEGAIAFELRDTDLAPFALGLALPGFDTTGEVTFAAPTTLQTFEAKGSVKASLSRLEAVMPELKSVGTLQIVSSFNAAKLAETIRLTELSIRITGAKPVATIAAVQPFEFVPATGEIRVADPAKQLVSISLQGLPLAWAQPFLGDLAVTGGDVRAEYVVQPSAGGFAVNAVRPLTVSGVTVTQAGKPLVQNIDLSLSVTGAYSPNGWQGEVKELTVGVAGLPFVRVEAKAGQIAGKGQPIKATGSYTIALPAALAQPVVAMPILTKGTAAGEFTASVAEVQQLAVQLRLEGLVATTKEVLPTLVADVRADVQADGAIDARIPLTLERAGRKSDLLLAVGAKPGKDKTVVKASVSSDVFYIEDAQILAAPLAAVPAPASAPSTPAPKPAGKSVATPTPTPALATTDKPVWSAVEGDLSLALKRVVYSPQLEVTNIAGSVVIGPAAVMLQNLQVVLSTGGTVTLGGGLQFKAGEAKPYQLKVDVAAKEIDSGPLMTALAADGQKPLVEGKFDVTTTVAATGADLGVIANEASGDLKVTSKSGVFRPVPPRYVDMLVKAREQIAKNSERANTLGALAGMLGSKAGDAISSITGKTQSLNEKLAVVESIVKALGEVNFDQLTLDLGGDTSLNTVLRDFTLISPELRFNGTGDFKYKSGVPLWKQDIALKILGGARGDMATLMQKGNLLGTQVDSLGYTGMSTPLEIGGTAEKPDAAKVVAQLLNKIMNVQLQPGDVEKLKQGDVGTLVSLLAQLK